MEWRYAVVVVVVVVVIAMVGIGEKISMHLER